MEICNHVEIDMHIDFAEEEEATRISNENEAKQILLEK